MLCENIWVQKHTITLPDLPRTLRLIHGQLWQCAYLNGIIVYDTELHILRTIPMPACIDVAELLNGDVVVVSVAGLFHLSKQGTVSHILHISFLIPLYNIAVLCKFIGITVC